MDDLTRVMWKESDGSSARCTLPFTECSFRVGMVSAATAGRSARQHTRDTGHATRVRHSQIVQYRRG